MNLLTFRNVSLSFGGDPLLDGIDLTIDSGERLCLVGRNGSGKSTLFRLIAGIHYADSGVVERRQGLKVAELAQEVPEGDAGSVFDVVADGLGEAGVLVARFHDISHRIAEGETELMERLEKVQHELESNDGWQVNQRVETVLSKLGLDGDSTFASLSGGLKRRVMLARALVQQPDLLLLDEPTNHLDIESINWLEQFLLGYGGTILFITHDRAFLQHLATRIIELDRGQLTSFPGDYANYLRRKQEMLDAEAKANAEFDKKLAQEEVWIRQGIKARRTRNEGRVRALKAMREERHARRERAGNVNMTMAESERSGKLVVEAKDVAYAYDNNPVFSGLNTTIMRGDRVGIIGPNGVGKSTLLKVLLGQLAPTEGSIKMGTNIELAYFDQLRDQLDGDQAVFDSVAEGRDRVTVGGQTRHIMSYLQDFLFSPERARSPVRSLSGGERNRLLLARLFLKPANLLVMDEPTNDLDVETLELLEELLQSYNGTLLLVSHDRAFLDNVVTSTLVFEGNGRIGEYVGGYEDWLRQRREPRAMAAKTAEAKAQSAPAPKPAAAPAKRKLSYKDQRELDALPARIEALEEGIAALHEQMGDPDFYQQDGAVIAEAKSQLEQLEADLQHAFERWEALED